MGDPITVAGAKIANLIKRRVPDPSRSFRGYAITLGGDQGEVVVVVSSTRERAIHWVRRMFPNYNVDVTKIQDIVLFGTHDTREET